MRPGGSGSFQTDRTYTGQKKDGTGLHFYNARYYDSALGTFLSPDTIVPDAGAVVDYTIGSCTCAGIPFGSAIPVGVVSSLRLPEMSGHSVVVAVESVPVQGSWRRMLLPSPSLAQPLPVVHRQPLALPPHRHWRAFR